MVIFHINLFHLYFLPTGKSEKSEHFDDEVSCNVCKRIYKSSGILKHIAKSTCKFEYPIRALKRLRKLAKKKTTNYNKRWKRENYDPKKKRTSIQRALREKQKSSTGKQRLKRR